MLIHSVNLRLILVFLILIATNLTCFAIPTPQEITNKINENNAKVLDLQATMITTIKSSMLGGQPITQRATFYKKGNDKSRVEMIIASSPPLGGFRGLNAGVQKQTTITNGDDTWLIGSDGQVVETPKATNTIAPGKSSASDPTAYLKYFDLTVEEVPSIVNSNQANQANQANQGSDYLITGTPKPNTELSNNEYFGSIKMYIDKTRYVPVQMQIYKQDGSLLMESTMSYVQIKDISVNDKSITKMTIAMPGQGAFQANNQTMEIVVEYKGLKVNEGLGDGLFNP